MKVHLRKRNQAKKGRISLFLEFYKGKVQGADGKWKNIKEYEYLELYLVDKPKTPTERQS
ncbi:MAG: site-specific integrase, partial [Cyclobacteriaceae bacterium]